MRGRGSLVVWCPPSCVRCRGGCVAWVSRAHSCRPCPPSLSSSLFLVVVVPFIVVLVLGVVFMGRPRCPRPLIVPVSRCCLPWFWCPVVLAWSCPSHPPSTLQAGACSSDGGLGFSPPCLPIIPAPPTLLVVIGVDWGAVVVAVWFVMKHLQSTL